MLISNFVIWKTNSSLCIDNLQVMKRNNTEVLFWKNVGFALYTPRKLLKSRCRNNPKNISSEGSEWCTFKSQNFEWACRFCWEWIFLNLYVSKSSDSVLSQQNGIIKNFLNCVAIKVKQISLPEYIIWRINLSCIPNL